MIPRRIMTSMLKISGGFAPAQQQVLTKGFDADTLPALRRALVTGNTSGAAGLRAIDEYLRHEETMRRYFTLYSRARWGPGVTLVQLRHGYRQVPPFNVRRTQSMAGANVTFTTVGFRPVADVRRDDAQRAFDSYVDQAPADDYTSVVREKGRIVTEPASR